jgi:hypothetical protein
VVTAMLILLAKSFIEPVHRLYAFDQQHAHKRTALLADRTQPAPTTRNSISSQNFVSLHPLGIRDANPLPLEVARPRTYRS